MSTRIPADSSFFALHDFSQTSAGFSGCGFEHAESVVIQSANMFFS
jgi:hypothetical protein